jgi:hypothetical protein
VAASKSSTLASCLENDALKTTSEQLPNHGKQLYCSFVIVAKALAKAINAPTTVKNMAILATSGIIQSLVVDHGVFVPY